MELFHPDPYTSVYSKILRRFPRTRIRQIERVHRTRKQACSAGRAFIVNHCQIIHQTKSSQRAGFNTAAAADALVFIYFQQGHGFSLKNFFRDNFIGEYCRRLLDTIGLYQVQHTFALGWAGNLYNLCRTSFQA
jgi:hypothetical protein